MLRTDDHLDIQQRIPWVSCIVTILYVAMFQWEKQALSVGLLEYLIRDYSFDWVKFTSNPIQQCPHLLSYTFLHADASHLISNGIFFLMVSFFCERFLGSFSFACLYISGAAVAAVVQGLINPFLSGLIGASGAIAAIAGAYFVLAPSFTSFKKYSVIIFLLMVWYTLEWMQQLHQPNTFIGISNNIAHGAHLGGFGWGALWGGIHLLMIRRHT